MPSWLLTAASHAVARLTKFKFSGYGPKPLYPFITKSEWVGVTLLAPLFETLFLALAIWMLRKTRLSNLFLAALCGVGFGLLHAWSRPLHFLGPSWSFFVFACGYLAWQQTSFKHAFAAAFIPHAINNAFAVAGAALVTGR